MNGKLIFDLSMLGIISFIILICSFLWTIFVVIAGISRVLFPYLIKAISKKSLLHLFGWKSDFYYSRYAFTFSNSSA